jgi:uncharacterized protein YbaR (Trm112 family)
MDLGPKSPRTKIITPDEKEIFMVSQELLEILRCPNCVREKEGLLDYIKESWLVCQDCGRKYPIRDDIPVMLIDEGDKWINVAVEDLPVPPPAE